MSVCVCLCQPLLAWPVRPSVSVRVLVLLPINDTQKLQIDGLRTRRWRTGEAAAKRTDSEPPAVQSTVFSLTEVRLLCENTAFPTPVRQTPACVAYVWSVK